MSEHPCAPGTNGGGRRVVVVDDEALVRELAVCELEEAGYTVRAFASADEALSHLTACPGETDVVFTDVQMPGTLNGLQLAGIISRSWPDMRVLVTSGGVVCDPAQMPPRTRFMAKPWRGPEVLHRIASLLGAGDSPYCLATP